MELQSLGRAELNILLCSVELIDKYILERIKILAIDFYIKFSLYLYSILLTFYFFQVLLSLVEIYLLY